MVKGFGCNGQCDAQWAGSTGNKFIPAREHFEHAFEGEDAMAHWFSNGSANTPPVSSEKMSWVAG